MEQKLLILPQSKHWQTDLTTSTNIEKNIYKKTLKQIIRILKDGIGNTR